ncbi:MAG: PD40 domain-containing protein [Acidobacteria bacterium]|nr:PD40 domain-containing protein [Acidobacteriota bacterium]
MNRLAPVSVFLACLATHVASAGVLEPISVASTGGTANQHSDTSTPVNLALRTVSADGRYVVFQSDGTNLVPGQIAPVPLRGTGLYLRDRVLGTTTLVSHSASSPLKNGDGNSQLASISADGRWVAYASSSTDLVAGIVDNNDDYDFFLFDRLDGSNTLISHDAIDPMTTANLGNSSTLIARISQDGRFVLYSSRATNLVAGQIDSNLSIDVFCYDRTTGDSMLVSRALASPSATGDHGGGGVAINADGRWILFVSSSTNLVAGQGPTPSQNVFLFDRTSGTSTLVSHRAAEPLVPGNQASASFLSSLSRDGRLSRTRVSRPIWSRARPWRQVWRTSISTTARPEQARSLPSALFPWLRPMRLPSSRS